MCVRQCTCVRALQRLDVLTTHTRVCTAVVVSMLVSAAGGLGVWMCDHREPEDRGGSKRLFPLPPSVRLFRRQRGREGLADIFLEVASVVLASLFLEAHQFGSLSPNDIMIGRRHHCTDTGLTPTRD